MELCTKRVLVMGRVTRSKLAVALKKDFGKYAAREGQSERFCRRPEGEEREFAERGEKVQGATASEYDLFIALEDKLKNAWSLLFNTVTVLTRAQRKGSIRDKKRATAQSRRW
jgi:hypothetical protein